MNRRRIMGLILMVIVWGTVFGSSLTRAADLSYTYIVNPDNTTCTIIGVSWPSGNVDIPNTINGYTVTAIGDSAFSECYSLTSINIPSGVTSIGNDAFSMCSSLTSINIPSSVTSIGNSAFGDCSSLTGINIPSSVTSIGIAAFGGCSSLTSITIPSSVTSIRDYTFYGCSSLTSITIPSGVNSIGDNAFSSSGALKAVYFKGYAPSIGTGIFDNCPSDCKVYYIASKGTGYTGWGYQKTAIYDTAPALSNVTPTVLAAGSALSATSNQTGTLYLVPKATYADKTALDNASPQKTAAVTTAGIAVSIDTGGLPEGTYQVYAVNNTGYPAAVAIFGLGFQVSPASTTITIDNNVPPGLSNVTPASLKAGTALSATSNQTGTVYLVPKGSYANKAALDGASPKKTAAVPTANTAVNIDTTGLVGGIYQVYAVNSAGKLSLPSADVTIDNTAPTAAVTYSKNPVKQGDSLTITANFSKALADSPPVRIAISGVNTLAATNMTKVSNTQYTYTYTVGTGDGAANVSFSTGTDILGNTVTATPTSGVSFTVDNTAPTVTAYTPVNNAADVRLNPALTLTFSEAVTAGSGNINIYKTGGAKVETIAASQATVNDKTVTFTPVNKLSLATGYYILIDATAFKDLAGNPYAGIANNNIWSFITATAPVYITFSRPAAGVKLNINTGSTVIVKLSDNGPGIDTAKVTIQIDNGPAVKPTSLVKTGDVYTLYYVITAINYRTGDHSHTVTVTAYDLAGAAYTGSVTFTMEPKRNGFGFGRVRYD